MSHQCKALIIHCIDFRLIDYIESFLKEKLNLRPGDYDFLGLAGGVKELVADENGGREFILKNIEVSINLHKVYQIIFVQHEDCGAYGGKEAFQDFRHEIETHKKDMDKAEEIIKEKFGKEKNIEIIKSFMCLDGRTKIFPPL
jgi:carbonic anhydrase